MSGHGDLHLVAEAHVALDHRTGHANVVRDLVNVVARGAPQQNAGATQAVNGRVGRVVGLDLPFVFPRRSQLRFTAATSVSGIGLIQIAADVKMNLLKPVAL